MDTDRKTVLLKATYDFLNKLKDKSFAIEALSITAHYDGAECDGYCIADDIEAELGLDGVLPKR